MSPLVGQPLFAVVDVETTGLSPSGCRVLEMAVVLADPSGQTVWEWSSRFNPQGPVGPTHIHGISAADVENAPLFGDHLGYISQALAGRVLVAHNADFDLAFLAAEYERAGWDMPYAPSICTMRAGRVYLPHLPRHRLGDCCEACGVQHVAAHSALGDARATVGVLGTYLTRTPDRGAWLEWQTAYEHARGLTWPTGPSRAAVAFTPDPRSRAWANMARSDAPPALVEVVAGMDLTDTLDEGAPEGSLDYLELLATVLEDGVLDDTERDALAQLATALHLDGEDVARAHEAFLRSLAHAALLDGKVSRVEKAELEHIAAVLNLHSGLVGQLTAAAEAARLARLSEGLTPLPADWAHGEPLRVGDKVVFTGCEAHNRDALEDRSNRLGVRVIGSVSRRITLLVSDGAMDGTKAADARAIGTRIIHPTEYVILLDHLQPAVSVAPKTVKVKTPRNLAPSVSTARTDNATTVVAAMQAAEPILTAPTVAPSVIRTWARAQGYDVGERGRLHSDVIAAYRRAHADPSIA